MGRTLDAAIHMNTNNILTQWRQLWAIDYQAYGELICSQYVLTLTNPME